jgi:hypothetical protein
MLEELFSVASLKHSRSASMGFGALARPAVAAGLPGPGAVRRGLGELGGGARGGGGRVWGRGDLEIDIRGRWRRLAQGTYLAYFGPIRLRSRNYAYLAFGQYGNLGGVLSNLAKC